MVSKLKIKKIYYIGITLKQPKDTYSRTTYNRTDGNHMLLIEREWKNDNSIIYFGDWHYHPADYVLPSITDYLTFNKNCKTVTTSSNYLFNIIVSKKELIIYAFSRDKAKEVFSDKIYLNYVLFKKNTDKIKFDLKLIRNGL